MAQEQQMVYVVDSSQQTPTPTYAPQASYKDGKADLLDKIKPDLIVEIIRHKLMGEEFINGEWRKVEALKDKAISFTGAWDISNLMLGVSSQNVALSKLSDKEIRARTLEIVKTAQYMMIKNWKEYHLKGVDQLYFVHQLIMSNTFITLKQPEGEGIRNLLKGTLTEARSITDQEHKKGGFLGGLFRK